MIPFNERAKAVFSALNTTPHKFASEHNFNRASVFNMVNPDRRPSLEMLERLCTVEPRISAEYLLRGEGDPIRGGDRIMPANIIDELRAVKDQLGQLIDGRIIELGS